ncbi:MAG: hypothetical protein HYX32_12130 [Actinobacteria bacterium]|nr:hypothetical protein [Actinomycetota bacterium]
MPDHQESVAAALGAIPGFRAYYLVKADDGATISVSVYEDKAGVDASTVAARDWIAANLPDLAVGPPEVVAGDAAFAI